MHSLHLFNCIECKDHLIYYSSIRIFRCGLIFAMFLPDVIVQKKTTEKIKHIKKPIMYQNDQCSISKSHKSKNNNISIKFVSLNHF